jgi:hypothetical protein
MELPWQSGGLGCTINGTPATLSYSSGQRANLRAPLGSPVAIADGSTVIFDALVYAWRRAVIWVGRNNYPRTGVPADVAEIVAANKTGKYLVMSVLNMASEPSGSPAYNDIAACNAVFAATYGARYLDVRAYLIAHGLTDAGITPTTQDLADIGNDVVPTSLRSDAIHLNAAGYTIVGAQVWAKLQALGF